MLINSSKIIVIKLGSSTVVDSKGKFKKKWVTSLIKDIKKYGGEKNFVIVSSGAIALGQKYLKIKKKKIKLEMSQAIAAIGQIHLAGEFQKIFDKFKIKSGQILISPDDTEQRKRALNIRSTFENLFKLKAVPIVNENDTTATTEIKYGDNDRLAARVAQIIGADTLIILSDVPIDACFPPVTLISFVVVLDPRDAAVADPLLPNVWVESISDNIRSPISTCADAIKIELRFREILPVLLLSSNLTSFTSDDEEEGKDRLSDLLPVGIVEAPTPPPRRDIFDYIIYKYNYIFIESRCAIKILNAKNNNPINMCISSYPW